jgi:predicted DNA-binding transcriptional regulator AlpA
MSDVDILDNETRVTQPDAARLLGNVSQMTIWRWRNNPELNFPSSIVINGRHYFRRSEILSWRPPVVRPPRRAGKTRIFSSDRRNG